MNPFSHTGLSISDSLKSVRKSVLIYETIIDIILRELEKSDPLPEKGVDQMAWVRATNKHRAIAEEIILEELIYV